MRNEETFAGAKQLRTVAKMWYRADHEAAKAACALVAGYPAGLLQARGVSPDAIASGKVRGEDRVVAWANERGDLLASGEDLHADRARAVLLTPGGTYRCTLAFAPDTPAGWFVAPLYRSEHRRPHQWGERRPARVNARSGSPAVCAAWQGHDGRTLTTPSWQASCGGASRTVARVASPARPPR